MTRCYYGFPLYRYGRPVGIGAFGANFCRHATSEDIPAVAHRAASPLATPHSLAVEEAGANVLAEGDESGAATSGESDASPTSPPSGAPVAAAGGAVPAKGSDSAGEPSPQSASATGSPPTSAQTSPEHAAAPAAAAAGDASASATGGVKAQPLPAPAVTSLSGKPTRFVTTKAPDILNAAADIAKPHDDEPSAHANASLVVPV